MAGKDLLKPKTIFWDHNESLRVVGVVKTISHDNNMLGFDFETSNGNSTLKIEGWG